MAELSKEQLIEFITREVMNTLGIGDSEPVDKSGCPAALVIGDADRLPGNVKKKYCLKQIEEYHGDISICDVIFITKLTKTELADIALGRDTEAASCAVIEGLIHGKEIFLYDIALSYRKYAGQGSRAFYQLLEGYVRTLQSFGIKLVQGTTVIDKYEKYAAPGADLPEGVITEALARKLTESGEGAIQVRRGTVITPSAKDVFLHADRELVFL